MTSKQTIALFGASNLWFSTGAAVQCLATAFQPPMEVYIASGPGRSYLTRGGNVLVQYEGHVRGSLLRKLERNKPEQLTVVLTDIGNDLIYGASSETLLAQLERILVRLKALNARVVVTQIPLESLLKLSKGLYYMIRSIYYFRCRIPYDPMMAMAGELHRGLTTLCREHRAALVDSQASWYSFDRFHLRPGAWKQAWSAWLKPFGVEPAIDAGIRLSGKSHWRRLPRHYRLLGREKQGSPKPWVPMPGLNVSFY
ncbi:MAG: hypothetical protein QNK37_03780 [Acidobacteriota bacterium]|nr:hypothetical protein [Acidobacteriota bacterium]